MKPMTIQQNVSLAEHSTMRLGGVAAYVCDVTSRTDVSEAVQWAINHHLPMLMIGSGSNIVWRDEASRGLVLVNKIMNYEVFDEDELNTYLTIGAGENWDSVVERSVQAGLSGIEALSLIPGTAGATPVQNVGAYGQEIAQSLVSVEAYDLETREFHSLPNSDCGFGYRTSRFKTADHGRFLITGLTLHLMHANPAPPFYPALQQYLNEHNIHECTPQTIRDAVIAIRSAKLPDPTKVANNGSFFANPIVDQTAFVQLQADHPEIVHWPLDDGRLKLSAAWLVERAGFKAVHDAETGMATWPNQSLVLVNEHAKSTGRPLEVQTKKSWTPSSKSSPSPSSKSRSCCLK